MCQNNSPTGRRASCSTIVLRPSSNTQATCSVRLLCHRPRHELQPTPIHHTPRNRTRPCTPIRSDTRRGSQHSSVAGSPASRLRCALPSIGNINTHYRWSRQNQACVRFGCFISIGIAQQHKHLSDLASIAMIDAIVRGSATLQTRHGRNRHHAPKRNLSSSKAPTPPTHRCSTARIEGTPLPWETTAPRSIVRLGETTDGL